MYAIKKPILGFENILTARFQKIDDVFAILKCENYAFGLINPFSLIKDYSFEIPADVKVLLDIKDGDSVYVYAPIVKQEPIKESIVNLKAPIIINPKNNTLAQIVLDNYGYYKLADFIKE